MEFSLWRLSVSDCHYPPTPTRPLPGPKEFIYSINNLKPNTMKVNDFIAVRFPQEENKAYYAIITNMMGDDRFKCTFVHSGNTYVFKKYSGWLEVMETTGLFPVGTRTNEVILFAEAEHSLSANSNV